MGNIYINNGGNRHSCLFDIFMTCITGGLWLIWMLLRRR